MVEKAVQPTIEQIEDITAIYVGNTTIILEKRAFEMAIASDHTYTHSQFRQIKENLLADEVSSTMLKITTKDDDITLLWLPLNDNQEVTDQSKGLIVIHYQAKYSSYEASEILTGRFTATCLITYQFNNTSPCCPKPYTETAIRIEQDRSLNMSLQQLQKLLLKLCASCIFSKICSRPNEQLEPFKTFAGLVSKLPPQKDTRKPLPLFARKES